MKILITGPKYYNYNEMISKAFMDLGYSVEILSYPDVEVNIFQYYQLFFSNIFVSKLNRSLTFDELRFKKSEIIKYNAILIEQINKYKPDLILTIMGNREIIFPETLEHIKKKTESMLIIWCYDSALKFINVLTYGKYSDLFYTFEPHDIQELKKYNIESKFLPMAYDPDTYHKLERKAEEVDISFVGYIYPNRREFFDNVIKNNPHLKIQLWGPWVHYNIYLQYEYKIRRKELGKRINNCQVIPRKVNEIYNGSKICLNCHHPQSIQGVNPRTFEIPGAGGFELTDYKEVLGDLFEIGTEIECYRNEKELFEKIEYYIENEDERIKISKRGHKRVLKDHTFKNRAKKIEDDIQYLKKQ